MAKQFLAIPKSGKVGDTNYLKQTIMSEILSEGWYRGQMNYVQTKLFGLTRVRGKLVYGKKLKNISDYARPNDASYKGRLVNRFLNLLGFTDSQKSSLYRDGHGSGIDSIGFDWQGTIEYSASDLNIVYQNILTILSNVEYIIITHKDGAGSLQPIVNNAGSFARDKIVQRQRWQTYTDDNGNEFSTFPGYETTSGGSMVNKSSWYGSGVKLIEFGGTEKTDVDGLVIDAIVCLIATSGSAFVDLQSSTQVGTWSFPGIWDKTIYDNESGYARKPIKSTFSGAIVEDIYKIKSNPTFAKDEFEKYAIIEDDKQGDVNDDGIRYNDSRGYDPIWSLYYHLGFNGIGELGNTFITEYPEPIWWLDQDTGGRFSNKRADRYLLVDAVKKYNFDNTIFYMSKFAHFNVNYKKKKSGFLGIGGIVGKILGGIVQGIVKILNTLGKIAYYSPELRLTVQIIMWVSTGKWTNDKDKFEIAFTKVIIIVIAFLIIWFSGGSATEQAIQFVIAAISALYSLYSLNSDFDKLDQIREMQQLQDAQQQISEEKAEDVSKVMDSEDDAIMSDDMFNGMFDDYDTIDRIYANPFDGQFDINLDIKIA